MPKEVDGIIDEIDRLVDGALQTGSPLSGYEYDHPEYDFCGHCGRHWHGMAITEKVATMYDYGTFDENYTVATDDSKVLCPGSDFIGPVNIPNRRLFPYDLYWGWVYNEIMDRIEAARELGASTLVVASDETLFGDEPGVAYVTSPLEFVMTMGPGWGVRTTTDEERAS